MGSASIGELVQRGRQYANRGDGVLHGRELLRRVAAADLHLKRVQLPKTLRGRWAGTPVRKEFEAERRRELEKEERRAGPPRSSGTA